MRSQTTQSTVYRAEQRELATDDRIQFTASVREQGIRTRDFGTVSAIADSNALTVRLDNGKTVELDPTRARHVEHGYAVDGLKAVYAERVLVSIEGASQVTQDSPLYRAISRNAQNTTIYAFDRSSIEQTEALEKVHSQKVAKLAPDKSIDTYPTKPELERLFTPAKSVVHQEQQQLQRSLVLGLGL